MMFFPNTNQVSFIFLLVEDMMHFLWLLGKPLSEQSEETLEFINSIL
jgi:hypothetical protein